MFRPIHFLLLAFVLSLGITRMSAAPGSDSGGEVRVRSIAAPSAPGGGLLPPDSFTNTFFRSLGTGSILLIIALGLTITFGLTGVINLAQGELVAIGAYTTYVVQNVFGEGLALTPFGHALHLGGLHATGESYGFYLVAALPLSFLAAALGGLILERCVIRFFYLRPLEGLLATWGMSQILQQLLFAIFGAKTVQVVPPGYLAGGLAFAGTSVEWSQLLIIATAAMVTLGVWLLLKHTSFGLLLRSVTQNPVMASCIGVRPKRVNMLTFALGSGLAGLAGSLLSLVTETGPTLGQGFQAESCLVVVFAGVGNIFGAVIGGLGLGSIQQFLHRYLPPLALDSAVASQLLVLGAVLLFLQWRPAGLFAVSRRNNSE